MVMRIDLQGILGGKRTPDPKRALDLVLGSVLLLMSAPLLLIATAAVAVRASVLDRHTTPGPRGIDRILVRDYRTGRDGHPFLLRSLRTRRFRLDLLSRLPEVVRGRMSLVGPAPLPLACAAAAPAWRQSVRPGLTGLAQVRRSSRLPWDASPLLDQHYVEEHWLGMDLLILLRSLPALRAPRGPRRPAPRAVPRRVRRQAARRQAIARQAAARQGIGPQPTARGARTSAAGGVPVLRARPGSRTADARVTPSDADHRSRRYIAAR